MHQVYAVIEIACQATALISQKMQTAVDLSRLLLRSWQSVWTSPAHPPISSMRQANVVKLCAAVTCHQQADCRGGEQVAVGVMQLLWMFNCSTTDKGVHRVYHVMRHSMLINCVLSSQCMQVAVQPKSFGSDGGVVPVQLAKPSMYLVNAVVLSAVARFQTLDRGEQVVAGVVKML